MMFLMKVELHTPVGIVRGKAGRGGAFAGQGQSEIENDMIHSRSAQMGSELLHTKRPARVDARPLSGHRAPENSGVRFARCFSKIP